MCSTFTINGFLKQKCYITIFYDILSIRIFLVNGKFRILNLRKELEIMSINSISAIGLGAIGCTYYSKLYDYNPNIIKIVAGGERGLRYKKNGFVINGKKYDFTYVNPEEKCSPADLVIISVKSTQLAQALCDIKNHIGKNTIIISLLNGITSEKIIGEYFKTDNIIYSLCIGDSNRDENRVDFSDMCHINFGEEKNDVYSENVKAVKELFDRSKINYNIPLDMIHELWWKFMVNVGINQVSAILKSNYGDFKKSGYAKELMNKAMFEVIELSKKAGVNLNEDDLNKWYKRLDSINPNSKTSMCQDIIYGRKTEVDIFAGTVCKLGENYDLDTPINRVFLDIIKAMEEVSN